MLKCHTVHIHYHHILFLSMFIILVYPHTAGISKELSSGTSVERLNLALLSCLRRRDGGGCAPHTLTPRLMETSASILPWVRIVNEGKIIQENV